MNSLFSEYLSPTNPIASGIVTFLLIIFFIWFAGLVVYLIWLLIKRHQIKKNENVQVLVNALREQDRGLKEDEQKVLAETTFYEFCEHSSLSKNTPVAKHLKAIFLAGWEESRLEVGDLIKHTTSNLFKWNRLLRSVLAVFIVIGLLGTLFGLTDSLIELSPALEARAADETSTENSEKMTEALSHLLNEIKGAFAPSILGIIFTVLGVIIYNVYLQLVCHPVESILEQLTLTVWVPQLYPTTSQKLIQTLHHSESQMRRGYETATQVGELVGTVQNNISDFNENLSRANAITQPLSNSVSQINTAADVLNEAFAQKLSEFLRQFAEKVTHLTDFQVEIRNLYQQLINESETFQKGANQKLDEQTQNLVNTLEALKSYEDAYITSRQQIDATLQNFLKEATDANTSISANNRQLLEQIGNQLTTDLDELHKTLDGQRNQLTTDLDELRKTLDGQRDQLTTDLDELGKTLNKQLETLTDRFNRFGTPLEESADRIEIIVEHFQTFMKRIVGDLQVESKKQNENYGEQLKAVKDLNQQIEALLKQLTENSENQSTAVSTLSSTVSSLTENTKNLTAAIQSFTTDSGALSTSIGAIEQHVDTLGTTSRELVEKADVTALTADIGSLNKTVGEIARHSQTLAASTERLARQIPPLTQNPSGEKNISFLKRIWNSLWRKKER